MEAQTLVPRIPNIFIQVNRLLALANSELASDLQRFGGYLTILDAEDGKVLLVLACGIVPKDKAEKYLQLSMEKATRVFKDKKHNTSWDSRNETNSQYPGAIKGIEAIYSFSGHQPDVDEAISTSTFLIMEPADNNLRQNSKASEELFSYYYNEVAERNCFIQPFIKSTNNWCGSFFMRHVVR